MNRTERTFYLLSGLYYASAWFMAPVYPLFLLSRGLDLFQMNLVLATFLICVFLFEVPTGALADRFGRKLSFLLSCGIRTFAFLLYFRAESFADCLIAEVIDAIGQTLASGALNAWAIDGMRAEGKLGPTDHFFARAQILMRSMMIVGGIIAGYVAQIDLALPWVVAALGFMATGLLAFARMDETPRAARVEPEHQRAYLEVLTTGLRTVRRSPVLLLLCGFTALICFAAIPAHMLWQVRIETMMDADPSLFGWVWAMVNVAAVVGSMLIPRFLMHAEREVVLCCATIWRAAMLMLAALATGLRPVVAGVVLQESAFGLTEPILEAWMNEHTRDEERATVLSVRSMLGTFGGSAGLVCLGLVARAYGVPTAWMISALLLLVSAALVLWFGRRLRTAGSVPRLSVVDSPGRQAA